MTKRWIYHDEVDENVIAQLSREINVNPTIAKNALSLINDVTSHTHIVLDNERQLELLRGKVGILNNLNGSNEILPLMGKPLITNRDKWNFYTMTDKNNMIKLPLSHKGKSCTSEYGCDNIYNGDTVYVEGYKNTYKATIYDNDTMRYIPFL